MSSDPYLGQLPFDLITAAGNASAFSNPVYTAVDFCDPTSGDFPQFNGLIPSGILNQFITMANASIAQARWAESWHYGMSLYIAHFATLYLQTVGKGNGATATQVIGAAQPTGLMTSESAGGLSASYDFNLVADELKGWSNFKSTEYGIQLASLGEMIGAAGMWIY